MVATATKMAGSKAVPKPRKELSRAERNSLEGKFALILTALLAERGWSSATLAEKIGFGEPAVRRWLRAEVMPTVEVLRLTGRALNTADHPFPDWRMLLPE